MVLNSPDPIRQLEAMRAGVEYRHPVQCRNFTLMLRPLTANENLHVYNAVQAEMMKAPAAARNAVHEHVLLAREYLKKASTADVGQAVGEITDPMLDYMTNDEILHLHKQYVVVMDKCNPSLETMTEQDLIILVDALKKKEGRQERVSFSTDRAIFLAIGEHGGIFSDQRRLTTGQVVWWVAHSLAGGKLGWVKNGHTSK